MVGQEYGKCINAEDEFIMTPQTSEVVKIFRRPSDGLFYWMDSQRNVFPFFGGDCDIQKQIITVDATNGNDADAAADKYNWCLSFKTLGAAKLASVAGDLIYVFPGQYSIFEQLAKPDVNYYFEQGAIVEHNATNLIDDLSGLPVSTKILGYGTFIQPFPAPGAGCTNISIPSSNVVFEFDSILGDTGAIFVGSAGSYNIKGKYIRNNFQYVVLGFSDCVWDFNVSKIDNICSTQGPTFVFALLSETIPGDGLVSTFNSNLINSNSNGAFGTVSTISCSANHKVVVNANIKHRVGDGSASFLSSVFAIVRGGIIEFSGYSNTNVGTGLIYGDFNSNTPSSLLINNSICNQIASSTNRPSFSVDNEFHWITIKDSIIIADTDDVCSVGGTPVPSSLEYGNLQISNSILRNTKANPASPTSVIKTNRISGVILLDNAVLENQNANPASYSVVSRGLNLPQSISILSGQATSDKVVEPLNILNNIVGTSIIVANQVLTNPLIK